MMATIAPANGVTFPRITNKSLLLKFIYLSPSNKLNCY